MLTDRCTLRAVEILIGILVGLAIGASVAGVVVMFRRKEHAEAEPGELADSVFALQRSVKLLQGRLNTLAPPRLGTGEIVDPGATSSAAEPETRAQVLTRYRYLQGLKARAGK